VEWSYSPREKFVMYGQRFTLKDICGMVIFPKGEALMYVWISVLTAGVI
jgi:hypothetical protein